MSSISSQSVFSIQIDGKEYFMYLPQWETDYIQSNLAKSSTPYELEMLQAMGSILEEKDLVLDIGANIGNHTFYLAKVVGCQVIAFEPNPIFHFSFQQSININNLEGLVSLVPKGVGKIESHGIFKDLNPQNLGAQALSIISTDEDSGSSDVLEIITLDSFLSELPIVKAIKVDVEGMELDVLRGAEKLIERDRPSLFIESHNEEEFLNIFNYIKKWDYVYWGTFNATPTNWFLPKGKALSLDLQEHQLQQGRKIYTLIAEKNHLRQSFLGMQARYKRIQNELNQLAGNSEASKIEILSSWDFSLFIDEDKG